MISEKRVSKQRQLKYVKKDCFRNVISKSYKVFKKPDKSDGFFQHISTANSHGHSVKPENNITGKSSFEGAVKSN
jgi:hypothetical protein